MTATNSGDRSNPPGDGITPARAGIPGGRPRRKSARGPSRSGCCARETLSATAAATGLQSPPPARLAVGRRASGGVCRGLLGAYVLRFELPVPPQEMDVFLEHAVVGAGDQVRSLPDRRPIRGLVGLRHLQRSYRLGAVYIGGDVPSLPRGSIFPRSRTPATTSRVR